MNLKVAQKRYKVVMEDGYTRGDEPWRYMEIRGIRGMIHPYNEHELVVLIKPGATSVKVLRTRKWPLLRDTDDGREFKAKNADLLHFCEVIGAFKKRQVSEKERKRLAALSEIHRPNKKAKK